MAATRVSGERVTITTDATLYTGAGRLMGFMVSHSNVAAQTIYFKDDTTLICQHRINPSIAPYYVNFSEAGGKLEGIPFTTSLIANKGVNCELNVWYVGY